MGAQFFVRDFALWFGETPGASTLIARFSPMAAGLSRDVETHLAETYALAEGRKALYVQAAVRKAQKANDTPRRYTARDIAGMRAAVARQVEERTPIAGDFYTISTNWDRVEAMLRTYIMANVDPAEVAALDDEFQFRNDSI